MDKDERLKQNAFSACLPEPTPIMRLHLGGGGCGSLHTNSRSVEEKNPEIQG